MAEESEMAEVSNELIYEVLKILQRDVGEVKSSIGDIKTELNALRGRMISLLQHRRSRADYGRGARFCCRRRAGARGLQRFPNSLRGRPSARRSHAQRAAEIHLP